MDYFKGNNVGTDNTSALSTREQDTISLTMAGLADKEIAANLGISVHTVRTYWDRIREKVGKTTRAEVISEVAHRLAKDSTASEIERRLAEADSKRYQLELLLGRIPIIVWSCDTAGEVIFMNDQFLAYAGEAKGRSISDLFSHLTPPELFIPMHEKAVAARQKQGVFEAQAPLRRVDGEMRWHLIRETPLDTQFDDQFLRVGTATDIHVLLARNSSSNAIDTRKSLAADLSEIGIAFFDTATGKSYSNPAYDQLTGSPAGSKDWTEAVHPDDVEATRKRWRQAIQQGIPFDSEHRYTSADGEIVKATTKVTCLPGMGWLFLGKLQDRSDLAVLDPEKLRQVITLLRDMLGFNMPTAPSTPSDKRR